MAAGILGLISVAINAAAAIVAPIVARRMTRQQDRLAAAEETLELVGSGLRVVEKAVEENKEELSATGAGDAIARTIRAYGPAAKQLVDAARSAAQRMQNEDNDER